MTTATKTKTSALAELESLEAAWAEARDRERDLGRTLKQKNDAARDLFNQRRQLTRREPGLVDHTEAPVADIPDNPVAAIDSQVQALGDLNDLAAQVNHARELERVARERFEAHAAAHGDEIDKARRREGEALLADYQAKADALAAVADRLVAFGQRSMQFAHIRRIDSRRVPIDAVANTARTARALATSPPPLPLQELDR